MTTPRVKTGPCGGPRQYAAKISCGRCNHHKKGCSFNPLDEGQRRKRKMREVEDKGEGSSRTLRTSRTSVATLDDESSEEEGRRKRTRRGEEVAREDEQEDPSRRLAKAYEQMGMAEVELAMAKIAMSEYMTWKVENQS
jgi:hypothetical protein